jgi:carboxymethylenebutenolidase
MTSMIDIATTEGSIAAYVATPTTALPLKGAVIVIHEIWGLVDHVKSIADRFAAEGYLAVAPDLLSGIGIVPEVGRELQELATSGDEAKRAEAQPILRERMSPMRSPEYAEWAVATLVRVVDHVAAQPGVDGRIAVVGFCFGGTYSFALAAADSRVRVAVPFYGAPPETARIENIRVPVLALYGDEDERLMESLPSVTQAMKDGGVDFTAHVYGDAGHAFFNDTNPLMYRPEVAADAWRRTLAFIESAL